MAFFAETTYEESYKDLGIVVNDYTDFDMIAMEACDTVQEMDNAIMQGIGKYELTQVREGAEVVYTEGMMDSIKAKIEKIWAFVKNWVKNVWTKFIAWLESYVRGDKAFLDKYKKKLDENLVYLNKDFDKTYKHAKTIETIDELINLNSIDDYTNKVNKVLNDIKAARKFVADSNSKSLDDALEKLSDEIEEQKESLKDTDNSKDVDANWVRSNFDKIKQTLLLDTSKIKKSMDKASKAADKASKAITDNIKNTKLTDTDFKTTNTQLLNACKSASSKLANLFTWLNSQTISELKGAKSDARSICRAILTAKPNPKYNESTIFSNNDFESYFKI